MKSAEEVLEAFDICADESNSCMVCPYINDESRTCNQKEITADVRALLEKQIPKTPALSDSGMFHICPSCNRIITRTEQNSGKREIPYCKWCGQRLDWPKAVMPSEQKLRERVEALERAIKDRDVNDKYAVYCAACLTCSHHSSEDCFSGLQGKCGLEKKNWQFDKARFSGKETS